MEDEKTILPPIALASLYKDCLVLPEKNNEAIFLNLAPLEYMGAHQKKITVVVKDPTAPFLKDADLTLLTSILSACKLTLEDIALINFANQVHSLHEIITTLPSSYLLVFEVTSEQLKIKLPNTFYKPMLLGETTILFCNSLQKMQGNEQTAKLEKSKLWNALKVMFSL